MLSFTDTIFNRSIILCILYSPPASIAWSSANLKALTILPPIFFSDDPRIVTTPAQFALHRTRIDVSCRGPGLTSWRQLTFFFIGVPLIDPWRAAVYGQSVASGSWVIRARDSLAYRHLSGDRTVQISMLGLHWSMAHL